MKRGVLITAIVFLILIVNVGAGKVDYKVEEELEDKEEVFVIVMLGDEPSSERDYSGVADRKLGNVLEEKRLEKIRNGVKRKQDRVLSELKLGKWERGKLKIQLSESEDIDFRLKHTYSIINGFTGKVTKKGLEKLRDDPNVARIYYDDVRHLSLPTSVPQINVDDVRALQPNGLNLTGQNQTVCVVDSGVDYRHLNIGNCSTENFTSGNCGRVLSGWDYENDDNDPIDDHGHGTHVAGIVASNHTTNRGVAPDAKLVALKVCDDSTDGNCQVSNIVSGIDWCINNKTKFNISIITISLGGGTYTGSCDAQADANASNVAVANGLFVSIAAGNNGCSGTGCTSKISSPACASNVTAVGSVNSADSISSFSNRASFNTIFAPGGSITSTVPTSGATTHTSANGFKAIGGTSMATPHIAGVAALMLQFNSSLSPLDIRRIMNDTGKAIDDSGTTYKRVDALAAIQAVDTIAPIWYGNVTNNTAPKQNYVVQFNITWNDTIGLSFYIFSWNDTGSWVNISNGTLSGRLQSVSVELNVTATRPNVVYWKFYCNDTNNNWNMTDEFSFSINDTSPNAPDLNFPLNGSIIRVNYTLLNWTATDDDNDSMDCYVYGGNQSNTTSLINVTKNIANGSASTFNWSSLNETTYYWKVRCDDNVSNSSNSSIYQFTVAIPPTTYPSLFSVVDYDSDGNMELNWSDDGNESSESYRIYRFTSNITSINSSVMNLTTGISAGTGFFEDNVTANGTTYWYTLVTVDAAGNYNDSVFSNVVNGTANDTIKPKAVTNVNVTGSGATATLSWYNISKDINGNFDFYDLQYVIYYGTNFNSSETLANESITSYSTATVSTNSTTISVTSSGTYHLVVTTLDDGGNKNLTLDYPNNYGNASLTYSSSSTSGSGGGGGGGGSSGGGGGGVATTTNLDVKTEFISGFGYTAKQTQGDEATFTIKDGGYVISVAKLRTDSVTINVAGAPSAFNVGDIKEFDVDSDGNNDVSVSLKKIIGGRAEIVYKMLARAEEVEEEPAIEEIKDVEEEIEIEQLVEEKPLWVRWFFVITIIILALLTAIYVAIRKYLKSSKKSGKRLSK